MTITKRLERLEAAQAEGKREETDFSEWTVPELETLRDLLVEGTEASLERARAHQRTVLARINGGAA